MAWNVYGKDIINPTHLQAIAVNEPPLVRWFVDLDRNVAGRRTIPTEQWWDDTYGAAFAALAVTGTTLAVQAQMKSSDWSGDGWPAGDPGLSWARAGVGRGWFADPAIYGAILATLAVALDAHAIPTIWGGWNEPDWRLPWPPWGTRQAPTAEWVVPRWLWWDGLPRHAFGWTGGLARLEAHRQAADEAIRTALPLNAPMWTTNGIGLEGGPWITDTAAQIASTPDRRIIDVHTYQQTADVHKDRIRRTVEALDPTASRPIIVGEFGFDAAEGQPWTPTLRDITRDVNDWGKDTYRGRWIGLCAHPQGSKAPALWAWPPGLVNFWTPAQSTP